MADAAHDEKFLAASKKHALVKGQTYRYGTAGFRMEAALLDGITFRVGLLASLRSRKQNGQAIGVMITASHNPAVDNGVKMVDPMGEMLDQDWEQYATFMVNSPSDDELLKYYKKFADINRIDLKAPAKVIYGRDTRPSGHSLALSLADALSVTNTVSVDHRILTTPQLHYLTRAMNTHGTALSYGEVSEVGYYKKLSDAFVRAMKNVKINGPLTVDCANGVGGPKLKELLKYIPQDQVAFDVKLVNQDVIRPELLNLDCGADYVKTKQRAPPVPKPQPGARCCSLDGDADRLIYYYTNPDTGFVMLDGDRISSLAASFVADLLERAQLTGELKMGVVQTAYANGASTMYLAQHLKLPVVCTPTGVKHLHHVATTFDIGVYFEANGHGTVLFSPFARHALQEKKPQSPAQKDALDLLLALGDMVNQTVGDAFSDLLLVEVMLAHKAWSLADWAMTYQDLPNRQLKVEVADKDAFLTTDAERRLLKPVGAQAEIDSFVMKFQDARAFVRASGTENVCRVYAEAATRAEADKLASLVESVVKKFGNPL